MKPLPDGTGSPTILVAEDDPLYRHVLEFTIRHAGYQVVVTGDGDAAWQRWLAGGIDLLVTDEQMPRCSGLELLGRMQEHQRWKVSQLSPSANKAILCTAKVWGVDDDPILLRDQVLAVLPKPFSPRQLTSRLQMHFASVATRLVSIY